MPGYLSLDIICSLKLDLCSQKSLCFSEQIMPADKINIQANLCAKWRLLSIFTPIGKKKVKSAYGPMWPTRPELIPVSVA